MSIYSVDSLEDVGRNLKVADTSKESRGTTNPRQSKISTKPQNHRPFYLNHVPSLLSPINDDGGSNETVQNCSRDRKTKTLGGRNAIIARGGLANASRRLESSTTTTKTKRKDERKEEEVEVKVEVKVEEGEKKEVEEKYESVHRREGWKKEANERTRKSKDDRLVRKPMGFFSKATPFSTKCGFRVEGVADEAAIEVTMKADKKLTNVFVLTSNAGTFKKPEASYLEIHRRRSCPPRYKLVVRSPEGSTLSIYGDSQREELNTEEESGRISCSSRDDQSELSFYRRLIEQSATRLPRTSRSCETVRNRSRPSPPPCITRNSVKSSDNFPGIWTPFKSSASESKLSKKPTYKPYTIEDYRSLPVPKPDRSLGPDKDEILAKREWLMRRRSYGDSVSERNRQQIVHTAQRFKSRRIAPRKCFLPPLKHRDIDPKTCVNSSMEKTENGRSGDEERNHSAKFAKSKKSVPMTSSLSRKLNSSRRIKKQGKLTNRSTVLNCSEMFEDPYLDTLRQRHLREKELVDKLIKHGTST